MPDQHDLQVISGRLERGEIDSAQYLEQLMRFVAAQIGCTRAGLRVFVDTPEGIRGRYQYFTEAKMERLRKQGFARKPVALEDGVDWYVRRLESERA